MGNSVLALVETTETVIIYDPSSYLDMGSYVFSIHAKRKMAFHVSVT